MNGSALVGRSSELRALDMSLAAATGGTPQLALVEGDPGVGKSALLRTFQQSQRETQTRMWAGDETETRLPFAMVSQLLNETRSFTDPFAAGAAVLASLGEGTATGPMLLVLDDVHLADAPSLVALNFALRRLRRDPLMAVLSVRSAHVGNLPSSMVRLAADNNSRLVLRGLSVQGVQQLAAAAGVGQLSRRAAERLQLMTNGNPLHLNALFSEVPLAELEQTDRPIPAPRSFAQLVLADLASTSNQARRTAMAASVLGERCALSSLFAVAGLETKRAVRALEELNNIRVLHVRPGTATAEFDHPLVRAAVYGDLGPAVRSELHLAAASVQGGAESLRHRMAAAIGTDPDLAADLEAWAAHEKEGGNLPGAAEAMMAAHRLTPTGPEADRRLLAAVELYSVGGDATTAQAHAEEIATLPESGPRLAVQARIAWLTGGTDDAVAHGQQAWARDDLNPTERDLVAAMLAQIEILRDRGGKAVTWATRALADGRLEPAQASHTRAQLALGLAISGRLDRALTMLADLPADPEDVDPARHPELSMRGHLKMWGGPPIAAQADLSVAAALTYGDMQPFRIVAASALGHTQFYAGQWDQSQATFEQILALAEDMGQAWILGFLHADAAAVPAARGDWAVAEDHLKTALATAAEAGAATAAYVDETAVLLATSRGDPDGVLRATERIRRTPEASAQRDLGMFWWPAHLIVALIELGLLDEAEVELALLMRHARPGERRTEAARLRIAGQLAAARHDLDRARQCLSTAVAMADDHVDALEQALALEAFGRFLRRRGERRSAVEHLTRGRTRFQALGAVPFVERCDRELAACGVRHPATPGTLDPLTPQERAVATLICAGRTNREAAAELVLSVKTVGYHLSNVYTKLGVHSRAQLIAALHERSSAPDVDT